MAKPIVTEQFTALGGFYLSYVEAGVQKTAFTFYISERQRDILESRAWEKAVTK
jgi:hypothetical protein